MAAPYLGAYGEINNGAHRKAADLIGAPALVWHQALWNAEHEFKKREDRAKVIQLYLQSVHSRIGQIAPGVEPPRSEIEVSPTDRVRVITFTFSWEGMRTKIRFEIHTEYLTITSAIDLSVDLSVPLDTTKDALRDKFTEYRHLLKSVNSLQDVIGGWAPKRDTPEYQSLTAKMRELHTDLHETIWTGIFDQAVLDSNGVLAQGVLGKRFADFRGLITCERYPDPRPHYESPDATRIADDLLQSPFYKADEDDRSRWHRIYFPDDLWARTRLNKAWPFLTAVQENFPGRFEYTVSRLLDGRMLYASALGPQPKEGGSGNERPLFFYLHSATQCERQIGRMVDRLCQLGTLRLASTIAMPAFKTVSQSLRNVEGQINNVRASIQSLITMSNKANYESEGASEIRQELEESITQKFGEIQKDMAKISTGDDVDSKALGDESIEYRLSRSRYYRTQFASLIDDLRLKRLEGYQPYNEFVRRRLEGAFGFIDAVEHRLHEIKSDWRALDQLYLTTNITILTGEIDVEQKLTKRVQDQIKSLQIFAETILLLGIAPYYLFGLIFVDGVGCNTRVKCDQIRWGELDVEQLGLVVIVLLCLMIFLLRQRKEIREYLKRLLRRLVGRFG